ncbi:MAG: N-acetyltransferase [Clostridiales bacterium]|nr:N-acetyltransferase [Clostridiales bacterium]
MKNDYTIRLETPADYNTVENLTREAFWNVYRPGCLEHYVLHMFRNRPEFVKELDLVLEIGGQIIGHVMFVRAEITTDDGRSLPIMTFGPISIHPDYQRKGYGKILLDYALDKAAEMGVGAVCMEGNIDFYGKCGFDVASKSGIHYYAEPREDVVPYFLLRQLQEGFLEGVTGVYRTPEGYFVDETEAEEFDRQFTPKIKLKLPGQLV